MNKMFFVLLILTCSFYPESVLAKHRDQNDSLCGIKRKFRKMGRRMKRVGRGFKRVGRGFKRVGRGFKRVGRGFKRVYRKICKKNRAGRLVCRAVRAAAKHYGKKFIRR